MIRTSNHLKAFTLIELLVVIAIVAVLLSVLIPALNYAKIQATGAICMANLNGLCKTYVLYAEDNDTWLVGSGTGRTDQPNGWNGWEEQKRPAWNASAPRKSVKNFVAYPQNEAHAFRNETLQDEIRGLERGGLWAYAESEKIYHCPSDKRYLRPPTGINAPNEKGGYRTYSIGCNYNGYGNGDGWATGEYLVQVEKANEILTPGARIVFVEEQDGQGYNVNTWNIYLIYSGFPNFWIGDPLSAVHNQRSTLGYADGHAEKHQWQDKAVVKTFEDKQKNGNQVPTNPIYLFGPDEGGDLSWFVRSYIPRIAPANAGFYPLTK